MKKRGPYKRVKSGHVDRPRSLFREEHEDIDVFLTWVGVVDRGYGKISVSYKVLGSKRQYRVPRVKNEWLDEKGLDAARYEVQKWKSANNNSLGHGRSLPQFYLEHRQDFFRWLNKTCKHHTINNYDDALVKYVFPYMVDRLKTNQPQ